MKSLDNRPPHLQNTYQAFPVSDAEGFGASRVRNDFGLDKKKT